MIQRSFNVDVDFLQMNKKIAPIDSETNQTKCDVMCVIRYICNFLKLEKNLPNSNAVLFLLCLHISLEIISFSA
jgi:hypothetical protein